MSLNKIISYTCFISIAVCLILGVSLFFEISLHHLIIKSFFFFGMSSVLLSATYLLINYCETCSSTMKKIISTFGFLVIFVGFFTYYGFFGMSKFWHVILGLGIIHLLLVELHMLGWTAKKQSIGTKVTFLLALVANLFLAFVFVVKISLISLKPFIILAALLSIGTLFYGVFFYQIKKEKPN